MFDDVTLRLVIQVRAELFERNLMEISQKVRHFLGPRMAMGGARGVKLDTVAGGEENGFRLGKLCAKFIKCLALLRGIERDFFADLERGAGVVETQEEQAAHQCLPPGMN